MSEYTPSAHSAAFVWVSALLFVLAPGIYGTLLYGQFFQALTGIGPNDPLSPLFGVFFFAIPMLVALSVGALLGGMIWTILLTSILPLNAARYWARYPTPHVPILTLYFTKLSDRVLNLRSPKNEREAEIQ